jgi:nucleoside-diphosphate-sugar epimerase
MRVLVTGSAGFIGAHAADRLALHGHDVVRTARRKPGDGTHEVRIADLAVDDLDALVAGCDAVIHCAARASPWGPRESFWRDNVTSTERLLAAATRAGSVRRFVHVSTPSIYFTGKEMRDRDERFTPPPRWPTFYAESKWMAECKVREAAALRPIILRPRAVFGPGDRAIVPRILAAAKRGVMPLPAGGRALIDLTCVENLLDAIESALLARAAAARARMAGFDNGSGEREVSPAACRSAGTTAHALRRGPALAHADAIHRRRAP